MEANKQILATPPPSHPQPCVSTTLPRLSPSVSVPRLSLSYCPLPLFICPQTCNFSFSYRGFHVFSAKTRSKVGVKTQLFIISTMWSRGKTAQCFFFFDDEQSVISPLVFASKKKSLLIKLKKLCLKNKKLIILVNQSDVSFSFKQLSVLCHPLSVYQSGFSEASRARPQFWQDSLTWTLWG